MCHEFARPGVAGSAALMPLAHCAMVRKQADFKLTPPTQIVPYTTYPTDSSVSIDSILFHAPLTQIVEPSLSDPSSASEHSDYLLFHIQRANHKTSMSQVFDHGARLQPFPTELSASQRYGCPRVTWLAKTRSFSLDSCLDF